MQKGIFSGDQMRKPLLLLFAFALVLTAARAVNASTDCQKWLADYKKALADKASAPKLLAAKHRVKAYAHRKVLLLSTAAHPAPTPVRASHPRPHLTPAQMLKRFDLLCGDLPVDAAPQVLDARMSPDEFVSESALAAPLETEGSPEDSTLIAENTPPGYDGQGVNTEIPSSGPFNPVYGPGFPGGGSPGVFIPPVVPPTAPPVAPPVAPVPEPGTLVFMLTGSAAALVGVRLRA